MRRLTPISTLVATVIGIAISATLIAQTRTASTAPAKVPEPQDVFGFQPGADYKLASHEQIVEYFRKLDAASDRIVVEDIGKSTQGRPMIMAVISSEANIKNRARYQEIARKLIVRARRERDRGAGAGERRQGHRLDRRRPARHRSGRRAAHARARLVAGQLRVGRGQARPRERHPPADAVDESRRPRHRPRLVSEEPRHAVRDDEPARASITTTSATTTIATGRCSRRSRRRAVARQLYFEWFPQIVYNHHQSGPVPEPHLGTADEGPGESQSRSAGGEHHQPDRRSDAEALRRGREARLQQPHAVRHLVERQHARRPRLSQHGRLPHRDIALSHGHAALLLGRRDSRDLWRAAQESAGEDSQRQLHESRGSVAAGRSASRSSTC